MKNILLIVVASILLTLQSCSMYSETTFHKDAATSTQINFDFKEAMQFAKSMVPDSLQEDQKLDELEKLPKVWTSFYDMELKDGVQVKNPDSIRIMKKMFLKSNFVDGEVAGMSMKLDHFTKSDYEIFEKAPSDKKMPVNTNNYKDWDGKKLIINTKDFNLSNLEKLMEDAPEEEDINLTKEEIKEKAEQTKMMMKMMNMKITSILKFENKIKSVTGKHDWVQQVDDHTIKLSLSSADLVDDDKKLLNKDEKIVIVTE